MVRPSNKPTVRIIWVGHASVLIEVGEYRLLTDPVVTQRLMHLRRRVPAVDVGTIDSVLISHLHMDHLHLPSMRRVAQGARVLMPSGGERLLKGLSVAGITGVSAGESVVLREPDESVAGVDVKVVHAEHHQERGPHSSLRAQPVGFVIEVGDKRIYFAGDTDEFEAMRELGRIDVALLPIWGWGSYLGTRHLNPSSAAKVAEWLDARHVVPIHWGTYSPFALKPGPPSWLNTSVEVFRKEMSNRGLADRLVVLSPGESLDV